MNYGEGRQLSERMSKLGHEKVDSPEEADIVVLNTCTVVETTEKRMIKRMSELRRAGKQVIVTGCMAKVQPNRISIRLPDSVILPPDSYSSFSDIVKEKYGSSQYCREFDYDTTEMIPIAQGCYGQCTYCITKFARGNLISYPEKDILSEFRSMISRGTREILITAQDTASYGSDHDTNLASLITKMLETEGDYRIRIGMMNPNSLRPVLDDLLESIDDPRVYKFFHIPVQSGSDEVLHRMNRHYTVNDFMDTINRIRKRYPEMSIATDVITGFPGETNEDHQKSLDLIKLLKADTVNITRFSPRPGTPAASMKQINGRIIAERSSEMTSVKNDVESAVNSKLLGRNMKVLITEKGKEGSVISRTENYRPIAIESEIPIGTFINVEITGYASTYLLGRVLNN